MAKRLEIVAVGKGSIDDVQGKIALTAYRADDAKKEAYNMGEISEANRAKMTAEQIALEEAKPFFNPREASLSTTLINRECDVVNAMLDAGFVGNINIHTLLQGVTLKYREMAKYKKQARESGMPFDVSLCFQPWHSEADKNAIVYMSDTLDKALEKKCSIRFIDVGLANYIELVVPAGLKIANGTVADFEGGKAMVADENGIKREVSVRNWPEFARKGAVIIKMARGSEKYPIYVLKRTLNADKTSKLEDVVSKNWKKCPDPEKATTTQKGDVAGLAA